MADVKKRLTTKERIAIYNVLKEHCQSVSGTDLATYEKGWDDIRVAREVAIPGVVAKRVAYLRRDVIGDIAAHKQHMDNAAPRSIAKDLVPAIVALQRDVAALTKAFNELADAIGEGARKVPERKP